MFLGLSGLTLQLESGLGPFLYFILNKGQASLGFHCITTTDTHNGIIPLAFKKPPDVVNLNKIIP